MQASRARRPGATMLIVLAAAGTLVIAGCTTTGDDEPLVQNPASHPWRADLDVFARVLPARHKNLYFQLPRDEFAAMVRELDARAR